MKRSSTVQLIDDLANHWDLPPEIMVVDDDDSDVAILMHALNGFGLKVTIAKNGKEAMEQFRAMYAQLFQDTGATAHPFDLIFLDLKLPDIGGLEVLRQMRKLWPPQPVVLISGMIDGVTGLGSQGPVCLDEKPITVDSVRLALAMHNIRMPTERRRPNRAAITASG